MLQEMNEFWSCAILSLCTFTRVAITYELRYRQRYPVFLIQATSLCLSPASPSPNLIFSPQGWKERGGKKAATHGIHESVVGDRLSWKKETPPVSQGQRSQIKPLLLLSLSLSRANFQKQKKRPLQQIAEIRFLRLFLSLFADSSV